MKHDDMENTGNLRFWFFVTSAWFSHWNVDIPRFYFNNNSRDWNSKFCIACDYCGSIKEKIATYQKGRLMPSFLSDRKIQTHRAVVGAQDILVDGCFFDLFPDPVGDQKIVDTPACVLLPGLEHVAPPGVALRGIGI